MPAINLDAIRRRAEAATPGTWKTGDRFGNRALGSSVAVISGSLPPIELDRRRNGRADAAFIAHARQDVPALLAEVDRLRRELDKTRAQRSPDVMTVLEEFRHVRHSKVGAGWEGRVSDMAWKVAIALDEAVQ